MKLYIDTGESENFTIKLDNDIIKEKSFREKSQKLLSVIACELERRSKNLSFLKEIEVNTGPGSFTGLRVGVSVANALGFSLKIPVNGKNIEKQGCLIPKY